MRRQEIVAFMVAAFESSIFFAPRDPGLTAEEVLEICRQAGYGDGESLDALPEAATRYFGQPNARLLPDQSQRVMWALFAIPQEPDHRNLAAFDFAQSQLTSLARSQGAAVACISRDVLVQQAVDAGIVRQDVEAAIAMWIVTGAFIEKEGVLRLAPGRHEHPLPSAQMNASIRQAPIRNERRARAHPIVAAVLRRRLNCQPISAEPFQAFGSRLVLLGHRPFEMWWAQTRTELSLLDVNSAPSSVVVLSAALVEGALTFVVKYARGLGLSSFGSSDYAESPHTWRFEKLVTSAAMGRDTAVIDEVLKQRAIRLSHLRQRIHAGRMLSEFPKGVPDLRPDEAEEALTTAKQVVRSVLDWIAKVSPSASL